MAGEGSFKKKGLQQAGTAERVKGLQLDCGKPSIENPFGSPGSSAVLSHIQTVGYSRPAPLIAMLPPPPPLTPPCVSLLLRFFEMIGEQPLVLTRLCLALNVSY